MYRINELLKLDKQIYHTQDLAILWGISNKNTLYTTIKRYVQKGILVPIYKGLYSTVPLNRLDHLSIGRAIIHNFTYLSTESVLAQAGAINQSLQAYTFVAGSAKKMIIGDATFMFRKLKADYLNNPAGISTQNGIFIASPERAAADIIYFNPRFHIDFPNLLNWEKVKQIQNEVGYK